MTNPYRVTIDPNGGPERTPDVPRAAVLRPVLWLVLVVSVIGNTVVSIRDVGTAIHLGFGVATTMCVAALIVHHLKTHAR